MKKTKLVLWILGSLIVGALWTLIAVRHPIVLHEQAAADEARALRTLRA